MLNSFQLEGDLVTKSSFFYSNGFIADGTDGYSIIHLLFFECRSIFASRNNSQVGYLADAMALEKQTS